MRRSTLMLVLLGVIEVLLVLGGIYMVNQVQSGAWNTPDPGEALSRILSVIGAAIPVVAVPFVILAIGLRRRGQ